MPILGDFCPQRLAKLASVLMNVGGYRRSFTFNIIGQFAVLSSQQHLSFAIKNSVFCDIMSIFIDN